MARCLIIGCGCRGLALTRELRARGHAVRATTRDPARCPELEAAGAEAHVGDPDRVATISRAFDHVGVAMILLGTATGDPEALAALHGPRLEMLLERMLDTTVRAVLYERAGSVPAAILAHGAERVRWACERSLIPYRLLDADPARHATWLAGAVTAVDGLLAPGPPAERRSLS